MQPALYSTLEQRNLAKKSIDYEEYLWQSTAKIPSFFIQDLIIWY